MTNETCWPHQLTLFPFFSFLLGPDTLRHVALCGATVFVAFRHSPHYFHPKERTGSFRQKGSESTPPIGKRDARRSDMLIFCLESRRPIEPTFSWSAYSSQWAIAKFLSFSLMYCDLPCWPWWPALLSYFFFCFVTCIVDKSQVNDGHFRSIFQLCIHIASWSSNLCVLAPMCERSELLQAQQAVVCRFLLDGLEDKARVAHV